MGEPPFNKTAEDADDVTEVTSSISLCCNVGQSDVIADDMVDATICGIDGELDDIDVDDDNDGDDINRPLSSVTLVIRPPTLTPLPLDTGFVNIVVVVVGIILLLLLFSKNIDDDGNFMFKILFMLFKI